MGCPQKFWISRASTPTNTKVLDDGKWYAVRPTCGAELVGMDPVDDPWRAFYTYELRNLSDLAELVCVSGQPVLVCRNAVDAGIPVPEGAKNGWGLMIVDDHIC